MLSPQQYAAPPVVTPQLWLAVALTAAKVSPPDTATGVLLLVSEPSPSSPELLSPQQYAAPAVVTPQLWYHPALITVKGSPPDTATGVLLLISEPLPSSP